MGFVVLIASVLIQICLGGVYAWSVFVVPLRETYLMTTAQTQIVFGATIGVFTISMIFAGKFLDRWGPRIVSLVGGVLFGAGYIFSSYSMGNFTGILIGAGVLVGAGIGFCYVCPLSTCVKWFPKYKGLVTGISVAGFGGGAVLLSSFANFLLKQGLNVLDVFYRVGLYSGIIIIFCSLFLSVPKESSDDKEQGKIPLGRLLKDKKFWTLFIGMFAGTFSGLLVIGNVKHMASTAGLSPQTALLSISALSIGNALGRLCWGVLSDRLKNKVIPLSLLFLGVVILLLTPSAFSAPFFLLMAGAVGFGFGGCFVIYTANTAERYGVNTISSVYPLVFLSYGLSGILGPPLGGYFYDITGNYVASVSIAAFVIFSGLVGVYLLDMRKKTVVVHEPVSASAPGISE